VHDVHEEKQASSPLVFQINIIPFLKKNISVKQIILPTIFTFGGWWHEASLNGIVKNANRGQKQATCCIFFIGSINCSTLLQKTYYLDLF